ncbi:MAG: helix-turn-helix transcriptional regulator [Opitutaceae bacterium]
MRFSRATFATFSDALEAFHGVPDRDRAARLEALRRAMTGIFPGWHIAIEPAEERTTGEVAADTLVLSVHGTRLRCILRRQARAARRFSARDRFLCLQMLAHLPGAIDHAGRGTSPDISWGCGALAAFPSTTAAGAPRLHARRRLPALESLRVPGLTPRERQVLHWVTVGLRDAEIAAKIDAAPRTVKKHVENILRKLGVETRLAAACAAAESSRQIAGSPR